MGSATSRPEERARTPRKAVSRARRRRLPRARWGAARPYPTRLGSALPRARGGTPGPAVLALRPALLVLLAST
eukprot:1561387-Pyramimonas_sp.AAC.1